MITEFFLDCFFGLADGFFSLLPDITWSVDTSAWEYARDIVDMVCYLLPISTIQQIVSMIIALLFFRVVIAFIRTVLGLIPYV